MCFGYVCALHSGWFPLTFSVNDLRLKSKVFPYSITSVGHEADPGFLTVGPQAT